MKKIFSALLILTMIFSMVCVSSSAATFINENFASMESFTQNFIAGAFYVEEGELFGYAEAKALQTKYNDAGTGIFDNTLQTWLTYDATITLAIGDDELSETGRYINLVYCNDNLQAYGRHDGRYMMGFTYDVEGECFRFGEGWDLNADSGDLELLPAVPMTIPTDGAEEFFTMGISVQKDNIRCFYNNQLIFNYTNPDKLIAMEINSPFLFWQDGNFIRVKNITVADAGSIFPVGMGGETPTQATTTKETTTRVEQVTVTNEKGEAVTDEKGEVVTDTVIITEAPADTNTGAVAGGNATATGDVTFIVVAAMVATFGCALIVKKVSVK